MSGNAALAAAKRRRNPVEGPTQSTSKNVSFSSNNEIQSGVKVYRDSAPTTPIKTILEHDRQIFFLERKVEELEELIETKNEGNDSQSMELTNQEIKTLKNTILKQQKSIQDLTSLVTNLRGTIITQNGNIDTLTERLDNLNTSDLSTIKEEVKNELNNKGTVKLEINEK
tara:strand:- start:960 stop:1469 length:510 start_codon:yes stop_codon:yes gene_type:complete